MSIYTLRSCLGAGDISWSFCSRWQQCGGKLQRSTLQTPFNLRNSFKTSNLNPTRWPGRKISVDSANTSQDMFAVGRLWKPLGFTIAVSGVSLVGAAIWQYESVRHQAILSKNKWWSGAQPPKYGQFRQHLNSWWRSISVADKIFAPICALNVLVLLAWRVPAWQPVMSMYFMSGLGSRAICSSMLLSVFSHYSFLHFGANMFVLHSFCEKAVSALGKEQFLAMYMSAGVVSSFTSLLYKALIKSPNPSLGASGAVMCVLAYICSKYPHSHLAVIFIPQFPFEAGTGLKALLCFDTLGCIFNWAFFDHAAHLGGSLFGIFWFYWGYEHIWRKREPIVSAWHKFRGPIQ